KRARMIGMVSNWRTSKIQCACGIRLPQVNPSALRGIIGNVGQATRGEQQRGFAFRHTRSPFYGGGLPTRPTPLTSVLRESICSQDPQIAKPILDNENGQGLICG